jgi:hypothetical protein
MGRPQDGHSWIRRMIRMRAASRRSTILRSVRRRALPSPQAAVERHSIKSGGRVLSHAGEAGRFYFDSFYQLPAFVSCILPQA